jgi:hypothetical protein
MNTAKIAKVFTIVGVVVSAYFLFQWWKNASNAPQKGYSGTIGQTGCGAWAGSNSPAYMMTAATPDQSVWGVPEETGSCPGSPSFMGGGHSCSDEGCHCN